MTHARDPPTFENPSEFSAELIDFVSKCLVKDPTLRSTAKELLEVLLNHITD